MSSFLVLNSNWFLSMEDAIEKVEAWTTEYNTFRPHSSLGGLTSHEMWKKSNNSLDLRV
ncbi:integrase core domain-containing protein [Pedobacter sp.]|uniref:integrase core domain-containing protein n=1 Tax=Pedobacter sp. TaxID=1411316 RepID=UPI003D7FA6AC